MKKQEIRQALEEGKKVVKDYYGNYGIVDSTGWLADIRSNQFAALASDTTLSFDVDTSEAFPIIIKKRNTK